MRWLNEGPIQDSSGGIVAWCDQKLIPSYVYPEISGYFLTTQAFGAAIVDVNADRISGCARFLSERVRKGHLGARPQEDGVFYNFDLGMIATGLMRAHSVFGAEVLTEGLRLTALLRDQILTHGMLPAWCRDGAPPQRGHKWSTAGVLHVAKCTQALLLANEYGLECARHAADLLVGATLRMLRAMELPLTCPGSTQIHLHPVLYCAEGLWIYGQATGSADALDASSNLLAFVSDQMGQDGALPGTVGELQAGEEQGDVLAQAARLAVLLGDPTGIADVIVKRLRRYLRSLEKVGTAVEYQAGSGHLNTWATSFAAQAFGVLQQGASEFSWRDLV